MSGGTSVHGCLTVDEKGEREMRDCVSSREQLNSTNPAQLKTTQDNFIIDSRGESI